MNKEAYINAQMQMVRFDTVDIIATSMEPEFPTETDPVMPSLGPDDTEIL